MADRTGQQLGNYRIVHLLGQGGFADVYLGEHIHLNTMAAIKVLHTQLVEDNIENFRTEARTVAHLVHPNIVRVLDFGVEGTTPFLVMEYAPNGTLRQRHPRGIPVPIGVVVPYVKQVASALQYAHNQKLIHRDIKPENMLVGSNDEILLSDFGIATMTQSARAQDMTTWDPAGTVAYMAPEQIQGKTVLASDQYALAIVVYEWLSGDRPFHGSYMEVVSQQISATPPPPREKVPGILSDVEQVVLTALAKDPQRRFGRIEAFANALEQAIQSKPSISVSSPPNISSHSQNLSEVPAMEASLIGPLGRTTLGSTRLTIGRAPDNNLVVNDGKASSHHAEIRPEGQYYSIVDLGSTNGTFINEQQIYSGMPRLLQAGDTIRIGDTRFSLEASPFQKGVSSSDGSTVRATPSSPGGVIANFGVNTNYGSSGATYPNMQSDYQATLPAQQPYTPPPPYMMSETQTPTYTPPSYGQQNQQISYTPPPPPQKRGSIARTIILAVVALIIILGGVGTFFVLHNNQVAQQNINATATAQANTNAHVTATANANVTATAAVNATATAVVTSHYPPFTNLALYDTLTSSSSQWGSGSQCQFTSAGYQVSVARAGYVQWCLNTKQLGDLAYQATMNIQQGDCGGLVFRYVDSNNFYLFEVCRDGTYNLSDFVSGKPTSLYANANKASSAIHQGANQSNVLAVSVQGDTVNMYVNGQSIDTATSTSLTSSTFNQGQIGLLADDTADPTSVTYTNVLVWTAS